MRFPALLVLLLLFACFAGGKAQPARQLFPGMEGAALQQALQRVYRPGTVLSYSQARDVMYSEIDNINDSVRCVYSGHQLYLDPREDPSQYLYRDGSPDGINCEHAWPRSMGAREGNPKSDMHHLFPTRTAVNEARRNYPFGEIDDRITEHWYYSSFSRNSRPSGEMIDAYSEAGNGHFEPREDFKGDIARAMFYFYTMYREEAEAAGPGFFSQQRLTFCQWNKADPPDAREISRSRAIARYQDGKPNPFVMDPSLAERAYCQAEE